MLAHLLTDAALLQRVLDVILLVLDFRDGDTEAEQDDHPGEYNSDQETIADERV